MYVQNCLKPGGQFIVTMYGKGEGKLTDEFLQYVKDRKYTLRSLKEVIQVKIQYRKNCNCSAFKNIQFAKNVGFDEVEGENITKRFEQILHKERQKAIQNKDLFMEVSITQIIRHL